MIASAGAKAGMPQGELSGDRANLTAILKVIGPLLYGQLFVAGKAIGAPALVHGAHQAAAQGAGEQGDTGDGRASE